MKPDKNAKHEPIDLKLPDRTKLSHLPRAHAAIRYLKARGFDPDELEVRWHVAYCDENSQVAPHFSEGRLLIPVYALVPAWGEAGPRTRRPLGWQARLITAAGASGRPKYLTARGMRKNDLLYGLPQATRNDGPIVLVEGVTDAWRIDTSVVALLGKSISSKQCELVRRHFSGRPLVVFLDRDAQPEAKEIRGQLRKMRDAAGDKAFVVIACPPDGCKDPGDCTYETAWKVIRAALRKAMKPG